MMCAKCRIEKHQSEFYRKGDGFQTWCKSCQNKVKRITRSRTETAEQKRKHNLSSRYGITPEQYDEKLKQQGGLCAICGEVPVRKVLDHNHETGAPRGILCHRCNIALPAIENKAYLESALKYLEAHK